MSLTALANLEKIGQLKAEKPHSAEIERMVSLARQRLQDASHSDLSVEGRFSSVYNAIHSAALAALRWHGYRSENRYLVFQSLQHTLQWPSTKWRIIDHAHRKRNLAEYEGFLEIEESSIAELRELAASLIKDVVQLTGSSTPN
jgi:hypothetical protein